MLVDQVLAPFLFCFCIKNGHDKIDLDKQAVGIYLDKGLRFR